MSQQTLLFRILRATHANGTHHKLALDALEHLRGPDAEAWRRLFLNEASSYLAGSKAPDKEFKDFTNHVLHVRDGYWGGAAEKTTSWYEHTVEALQARDWAQAAYAAGVMSHYYTDPIMPFHTAQSEAENNIHRATEWSISRAYDELNRLARSEFPLPDVLIEDRDDWIADLVCDAAEISNTFYEKLIANYDIDRGVVDPVTGLNERARRIVAQLLTYAQIGQARILERAFSEAGVQPPTVSLTAETAIATLQIPIRWVLRKMDDAADRAVVTAMYDELQANGRVEKHLPADDRVVRDRFRTEVGEKSPAPRPVFRPPHIGGAFDYATALKSRAAVVNVAEPTEEKAAKSQPEVAEETTQSATKKVVAPKQPKTETAASSEAAPAQQQAADSAVSVSKSLVGADEPAAASTVDQPAGKSKSGKASKHARIPLELPKIGREDRNITDKAEQTKPAPATASEASQAQDEIDEGFDAAAMLRDRAAEMDAADKSAGQPSTSADFRLRREDEVEDGPSVGPKTALRLNKVGIVTVQDLLDADPQQTADAVDVPYIRAKTVVDWQDQARLQCDVPGLAGTASQLLVGAEVRSATDLASQDPDELTEAVAAFSESSEGTRLLRDRAAPGRAQIAKWIANAAFASASKAA